MLFDDTTGEPHHTFDYCILIITCRLLNLPTKNFKTEVANDWNNFHLKLSLNHVSFMSLNAVLNFNHLFLLASWMMKAEE